MPGYPVSAALNADIFVRPLIERMLGAESSSREMIDATSTRKIMSPIGDDEYVRVRCARVGERMLASPLPRGAGRIMTLSRADGLLVIPAGEEGVHAGESVKIELLRPRSEIERTILVTGSHDLSLDLVAAETARAHPGVRLVSMNVGSLGGLVAMQKGETHVAGCHLLDEETGEYNVPYVRRMVGDREIVIRTLVDRDQGLLVKKDNPKGIRSLEDLQRDDVRYVGH